jgi:predicted site-specific integrase-resolvase
MTNRKIAPLWTVHDVADYLQVPVQTLYTWRSQGSGPPCGRVGKHLRYDPDEVVAWWKAQQGKVA